MNLKRGYNNQLGILNSMQEVHSDFSC